MIVGCVLRLVAIAESTSVMIVDHTLLWMTNNYNNEDAMMPAIITVVNDNNAQSTKTITIYNND